jgi:Xanthosine triphosphate pyrophosphatase
MTRKFTETRILFATHNAGKLEEVQQLFAPYGVSVVGAAEMNLPEPEETENTFVGNARIKAHAATKATGIPALSDDSGIEVEALDNAPGVYTADWAETPNGRDFLMAMTKTHDLLEKANAPTPPGKVLRHDGPGLAGWPRRGF